MRKSGGLIKLTPSAIESRETSIEESWSELAWDPEADGSDGENADVDMEGDGESEQSGESQGSGAENEDEGEEEDDQTEEDHPTILSGKQKRKRPAEPSLPPPPRKKVAFAPDPKSSKQSRSAGSLGAKKPQSIEAATGAATKTKPPKPVPEIRRKTANMAGKQKASKPLEGGTGDEAYDFAKFF